MFILILSFRFLILQIPVLILVAIIATIGVYGIVALIVRMDDLGYAFIAKGKQYNKKFLGNIGKFLVGSLPWVIKILAIVGTLAMLLVAGGIFVHNIHQLHELVHLIPAIIGELLVGLLVGILVLGVVKLILWTKSKVFA